MIDICTEVYAVRAVMVDGSTQDLLLFADRVDAERQRDYISHACPLLGYDNINVIKRRVIGRKESIERRYKHAVTSHQRRRGDVTEKRRRA